MAKKHYPPYPAPWAGPRLRPGPSTAGFPTPQQQGIYLGPRANPRPGKVQGK